MSDREYRELKFKFKRLAKDLGRAGETIHRHRAEIALLRLVAKSNRDLATSILMEDNNYLRGENENLRKQLRGEEDRHHHTRVRLAEVYKANREAEANA